MRGMAPTAPDIGTRIRKRRQALGIRNQQELADLVGVNRSTVSDWETGRFYPGRFLGKLEAVLGIRLDEPEQPRISGELRRMIGGLTPDERAWVLAELSKAEHHGAG